MNNIIENNIIENNIPLLEAKKRVRESYQPLFDVLDSLSGFYPIESAPHKKNQKQVVSFKQRIKGITVILSPEDAIFIQNEISVKLMPQIYKMIITKEGTRSEFILKYSPEEVFSVSNKEFAKEIYTELKQILDDITLQDKLNKIAQVNIELEKEIKL